MTTLEGRVGEPSYAQAIPIYLKSDLAARQYFAEHLAELDAVTGPHLMVILPQEVGQDDATGVIGGLQLGTGSTRRFPDLNLRDLPCLWIEDGQGSHGVLKLPRDFADTAALFLALADACKQTQSAPKIVSETLVNFGDGLKDRPTGLAILTGGLPMTKSRERLLALILGVVFVSIILVIALFIPTPTPFQYTIFRIVLALAAGGFVSMTPGFVEFNISNWLRAGGALAVFAIVYFYSPAAIHSLTGK